MSTPTSADAVATVITGASWPRILTWRSEDGNLLESVRVQLTGDRIKAYGRIIAAPSADGPAFNASYDLVTDDEGVTKRLSVHALTEAGEAQVTIARDGENHWLVQGAQGSERGFFSGALSVDVLKSAFFNALTIRRFDLQSHPEEIDVPVVYVDLPTLAVKETVINYDGAADGITVISPISSSKISVDADGFVVDYPGLSRRVE
ncbi:putative glycolipid-binding domain-containing protein [Tsukamurella sp. M9C]|uniref:putative glycolipid-binding domain-containing protein n=1 Tax=unclassified Tsukamurella TaxID=2633480 RepID=UPI001CCC2019|nr:putative glycolipid-binding domain-containing protein [Tsukamurella sp. M9C]MCA0157213.1 putative glycolipid-binding domain-containing protein [Tsukamurella sp. M9C]